MKRYKQIIIFISFLIFLNACTNSRIASQANMPVDYINIQHRIDVANQLFKQHAYYESLVQWKILRSIQPDNPQYKNRIRVLQALIKRRLRNHLNNAELALNKKDSKTAEWEFLKVLALDPNHAIAIKEIKHIEAERAESKQARKTEKLRKKHILALNNTKTTEEYSVENSLDDSSEDHSEGSSEDKENEQALLYLDMGKELFNKKDWSASIREINKYLSSNPSDKDAINIATISHQKLSKMFEDRGHLEPAIQHMEDLIELNNADQLKKQKFSNKLTHLKQKLSANYYIEGVKVYRDNIDQAISYWKRAIAINPENEKAEIRLRKSEKMKKKLDKIQPK